jgi:hypothetical protein
MPGAVQLSQMGLADSTSPSGMGLSRVGYMQATS